MASASNVFRAMGQPVRGAVLLLGMSLPLLAQAPLTPPQQDYVLHFNENQAAATSGAATPNLAAEFTIEAWVYLEKPVASAPIVVRPDDPDIPDVGRATGLFFGDGTHPVFGQSTGQPGGFRGIGAATPLALRAWTHVAGILQAGTLSIFINGSLSGTNTSLGPPGASTAPFYIGGRPVNGGVFGGFVGALRQVRVWNRALTAQELAAQATRFLTGSEQGLVGCWPLDDGAGLGARDVSTQRANLTFPSGPVSNQLDPTWWLIRDDGPFFVIDKYDIPASWFDQTGKPAPITEFFPIDFDGDGYMDVIAGGVDFANYAPVPLRALRNDGHGVLSDATATVLGSVSAILPTRAGVLDFNGDGRPDLFIDDSGPDVASTHGGQARLLIQSSDGRLVDETSSRLPSFLAQTHDMAAGDVDGDGHPDVYLSNICCGAPQLLINDGTGHFTAHSEKLPPELQAIAGSTPEIGTFTSCYLVDVNRDGALDLILGSSPYDVAGSVSSPDRILLNDGHGNFTFASVTAIPRRHGGPDRITVRITSADFDGDGWPDLLRSTIKFDYTEPFLELLLNNHDGTFRDASDRIPQNWRVGMPDTSGQCCVSWIEWMSPVDLNGDGWPDLIVAGQAGMQVFLNDHGKQFVNVSAILPIGPTNAIVRPVDLRHSANPDVVILGWTGYSYYIARNINPFTGAVAPPPAATWLLPSSARIAGAGGAYYTTDLTISNTGPVDAWVAVKFLGHDADGSGGVEKGFPLDAGTSQAFTDVLGSLFGVDSGYGAIRVSSDRTTLSVTGQTSTPGPTGGTFGQSVPGSGINDLVWGGAPRSILAVREDSAFRTNLILTNPTRKNLDVQVALVSEAGATLGQKTYTLPPLGMTQVSHVVRDLGASGDVSGARLQLSTFDPGTSFAAYASAIDNVTNDPRTLLPARGSSILPSSARAQGSGGAFYTTDLSLSNLGGADATITLKFLGHDQDGRSGTEMTVSLAPGKSVTYADVLKSTFAVDSGYGAIQLKTTASGVVATSQTSTPGPNGGTFGQSVPVLGGTDFITSDTPRSILGIREDGSFRTNLILTNATESPLDVDVALVTGSGTSLGTQRVTLPPLGMTQVSRVVRALGVTADITGARLVLSTPTAGGALAAYASVIDNATNDPRTLLAR
jgi:hypothetical protein